ncbi:uncharacterized protein B0P05DRAFT_454458, partial [Gilbertella persicaria]|uniref:uncharacterized protein n=1 Tax=Gilbertella persicaria TaxID=101096 RepID=UPI00221E5B59
ELNPIENFWSVLKGKVQRTQFNDTEDLKSRIVESCGYIEPIVLKNTVQHSVNNFQKCLRSEPL